MKSIVALLLGLVFLGMPQVTFAVEPPDVVFVGNEWRVDSEAQLEYMKARRYEKFGNVLLGTGFVLAILGTIAVEADAWGGFGKAGFTAVGTGIGVMVSGMFVLSFPLRGIDPNQERRR